MSAFAPSLRFLHSLRQFDYLMQALSEGLLFTAHNVEFRPVTATDDWCRLFAELEPLLFGKLQQIGTPWEALSEDQRRGLLFGLGAVKAPIPMICLTEVPAGRSTDFHQYQFGPYGLFIRQSWLDRNGADRVLYVGDKSAVSERLFRFVAMANILGLHRGPAGAPLFENLILNAALELIAYVEARGNLEELEWRIAGKHGLMGGGKDAGRRLPLALEDIEAVIVKEQSEIDAVRKLLSQLASAQSTSAIPPVECRVDV